MTKSNPQGHIMHEHYNPALGMVIKGKTHYKQVLKEKGLIEIGNERKAWDDLPKIGEKREAESHKRADEAAIRKLKYHGY